MGSKKSCDILFCRCIPFRYRANNDETSDDEHKKLVEVLMINSQSGPGLLFPKVLYFKHLGSEISMQQLEYNGESFNFIFGVFM
jgi:hypothetical protein